MYLVGLTGGIASGKSTVCKMLMDRGCPIVDTDRIAREVVEPDTIGYKKIVSRFGENILLENGDINREKLGEIVFGDDVERKALNAITHPEIMKTMAMRILWLAVRGHQFAILDVPLLFETKKLLKFLSASVVISCGEQVQLERLLARNGYTLEHAQQRIASQIPMADKCRQATYVINNSKDMDYTKEQVLDLYHQLRRSNTHWVYRGVLLGVMVPVVAFTVKILQYMCSSWVVSS